jgi:hypothetical protein
MGSAFTIIHPPNSIVPNKFLLAYFTLNFPPTFLILSMALCATSSDHYPYDNLVNAKLNFKNLSFPLRNFLCYSLNLHLLRPCTPTFLLLSPRQIISFLTQLAAFANLSMKYSPFITFMQDEYLITTSWQ